MTEEPRVEIRHLTVTYGEELAVDDLTFSVGSGVLFGIVGPNGSGKSSTLKSMIGEVQPAAGTLRFFGEPLARNRPRVAYVPQRSAVDWDFPITVQDVVSQGRFPHLGLFRRMTLDDKKIVDESLERVGISNLSSRGIGELSGGQQQRTFLARALAQRADIYLLDEPFAGVDAATEAAILDVLRELRDRGATIVVVHHQLESVSRIFDEVLLLRTSRVALGPVAEVFTRQNLSRTYGGSLVFLDSTSGVA